MQVVERHIIDRKDPRYQVIDDEAFKSKNLYNAALYVMRQSFIFECKRLSHSYLEKRIQQNEAYKMLPAKVAQKVLDQLDKDKDKQNFVYIPHARFIHMLCYKAELVGIQVILTEESYTSQASFLDRDPLPKYDSKDRIKHKFSGRRKKGIYEASGKRLIHSDVQGSYNIIRKVAPKTFEGVEDAVVVHPVRIALTKPRKKAF